MVRQRVRRTITAAIAFVAITTGGLAACSADEATRAASPAPERSRTTGPARPKPDGAADTPTSPPPMHVVDETPLGNDEDPLVVVVGDSLTVTVADELRGALGSRRTMFAAWYGEGWSGGPFSMVSGTVSLVADVGETFVDLEPAAIVLALGTNDAWQLDAGEVALAAVDRYHALFVNTCVIAVTVAEDVPEQSTYDGQGAAAINERLRRAADVVVPWAEHVAESPELVAADGIHLSPEGKAARVAAIGAAVNQCTP